MKYFPINCITFSCHSNNINLLPPTIWCWNRPIQGRSHVHIITFYTWEGQQWIDRSSKSQVDIRDSKDSVWSQTKWLCAVNIKVIATIHCGDSFTLPMIFCKNSNFSNLFYTLMKNWQMKARQELPFIIIIFR